MFGKLWNFFRHSTAVQKLLDLAGIWKLVYAGVVVMASVLAAGWSMLSSMSGPVTFLVLLGVASFSAFLLAQSISLFYKWKDRNPDVTWNVPPHAWAIIAVIVVLGGLGWFGSQYPKSPSGSVATATTTVRSTAASGNSGSGLESDPPRNVDVTKQQTRKVVKVPIPPQSVPSAPNGPRGLIVMGGDYSNNGGHGMELPSDSDAKLIGVRASGNSGSGLSVGDTRKEPTPPVTLNSPGGFAITGGTVNNPTVVNNNSTVLSGSIGNLKDRLITASNDLETALNFRMRNEQAERSKIASGAPEQYARVILDSTRKLSDIFRSQYQDRVISLREECASKNYIDRSLDSTLMGVIQQEKNFDQKMRSDPSSTLSDWWINAGSVNLVVDSLRRLAAQIP